MFDATSHAESNPKLSHKQDRHFPNHLYASLKCPLEYLLLHRQKQVTWVQHSDKLVGVLGQENFVGLSVVFENQWNAAAQGNRAYLQPTITT